MNQIYAVRPIQSPHVDVTNCQFLGGWQSCVEWLMVPGGRLSVDNSFFSVGSAAVTIVYEDRNLADVKVAVTRNTIVAGSGFAAITVSGATGATAKDPVVQVESSRNVCDGFDVFLALTYGLADQEQLNAFDDASVLRGWLNWREQNNLYSSGRRFIRSATFVGSSSPRSVTLCENQTEWDEFWGLQSTSSAEGQIRFQGGDLRKGAATVEKLPPEHFRLAPQSPGSGAGPDGEDLGANVGLIGPGTAYERWKGTAEYQQWLKDTGQSK